MLEMYIQFGCPFIDPVVCLGLRFLLFMIMCVSVPVRGGICTRVQSLQRPEKGIGSPEAGAPGDCEPPHMGAGTQMTLLQELPVRAALRSESSLMALFVLFMFAYLREKNKF